MSETPGDSTLQCHTTQMKSGTYLGRYVLYGPEKDTSFYNHLGSAYI